MVPPLRLLRDYTSLSNLKPIPQKWLIKALVVTQMPSHLSPSAQSPQACIPTPGPSPCPGLGQPLPLHPQILLFLQVPPSAFQPAGTSELTGET